MTTLDPRFGIVISQLSDPANITVVRDALLGTLALMAAVSGGTFAARPAFGTFGRFYRQTDVGGTNVAGTITFDTGAAWVAMNPVDADAATASMRTLGTTATSAAAGNDARLLAGQNAIKMSVRAVGLVNVDVNNPGTDTYDGVGLTPTNRVLLTAQSTSSQNGIWVYGGSPSSPLTRPTDFDGTLASRSGVMVSVIGGSGPNASSVWMMTTNDSNLVIGTDAQAWSLVASIDASMRSRAETISGQKTFSAAPIFSVQAFAATGSILGTGGKNVTFAGAAAQTLTLPAAVVGMEFTIRNIDTADQVTLSRAGADTINNGLTTIPIGAGTVVDVFVDASGHWTASEMPVAVASGKFLASTGAPTHTLSGSWQKVADGGGTDTWTAIRDIRPNGVSAQVDLATNKRLDIRVPGLYMVKGQVQFQLMQGDFSINAAVYVTGSQVRQAGLVQAGTTTAAPIAASFDGVLSLAQGDYLELYAHQNESASELYHSTLSSYTLIEATRIGPAW